MWSGYADQNKVSHTGAELRKRRKWTVTVSWRKSKYSVALLIKEFGPARLEKDLLAAQEFTNALLVHKAEL